MTQREHRLSTRIRKDLNLAFGRDIFLWKVWGNEHQMSGLPDLVGVYKGRFFGIETKLPETRDNLSPRQAYVSGLITAAGGAFSVCTTTHEAIRFIESLDDQDDADS